METWSIVTGANRGLGKAITRVLLEDGSPVVGICRTNQLPLEPPVEGTYLVYALDLLDYGQILQFGRWLKDRGMVVKCLVNNAGVCLDGGGSFSVEDAGFRDLTPDDLELTFRVNLFASIYMIQAVCQQMIPGGLVLNVSSALGNDQKLDAGWLAYRTSKAALNAVTRILARELASSRILVNGVEPGWVRTFMGGPQAPIEPIVAATWILAVIRDLLAGRLESGAVLSCDP